MESEPKKVKLGSREFELELPASVAVRRDVVDAAVTNWRRAFCAALGLCVPRLERMLKVPSLQACGFSVGAYGGRILDGLTEQNVELDEIMSAGLQAYTLVRDAVIGQQEVEEAEGFSGPVEAGSTST